MKVPQGLLHRVYLIGQNTAATPNGQFNRTSSHSPVGFAASVLCLWNRIHFLVIMLESTDIDCETVQVYPDIIEIVVFGGVCFYKM